MNATDAEALNRQFGIPEMVRFDANAQGLLRARVRTALAEAEVYVQGAHVTHYQPRGQPPVLFLSSQSRFEPGRAIRGGVPLVFPWFGALSQAPDAPAHGFARTRVWQLASVERRDDGAVQLALALRGDGAQSPFWPHPFALRYEITIGAQLKLQLQVQNPGTQPFRCEAAFHTYLAVADVHRCQVEGLDNTEYLDKTDGFRRYRQNGPVRFSSETDRIYLGTPSTCVLDDPGHARRLVVEKRNSATTVVWNPWIDKTLSFPDLHDEDWRSMLCIETANIGDDAVSLRPGDKHRLEAVIYTAPYA